MPYYLIIHSNRFREGCHLLMINLNERTAVYKAPPSMAEMILCIFRAK
jgi:hypothetical protein